MSLEVATQNILDFLSLIPVNYENLNRYSLKTKKGKMELAGLINNESFSLAKLAQIENSECEWHVNEELCNFILVRGCPFYVEYIKDNENIKRKVEFNTNCYVESGLPHRILEAEGYSESLIILVPGNKVFPKGQYECING